MAIQTIIQFSAKYRNRSKSVIKGGKNMSLNPRGGGGGRLPYKKGRDARHLSHRVVNFGFWSHLRCSGKNAIICSREGLL